MREFLHTISSMTFWSHLVARYASMGPLIPIVLAMVESFIPPLPLVAIVALNVAAHGPVLGFIYSWVGTCIGCTITFFFFRKLFGRWFEKLSVSHKYVKKAREWVDGTGGAALFLLIMMPFTPSAFVNFAFGISEYDAKKYLRTLYLAKLVMIASLAILGESAVKAADNPLFLILVVILFFVLYYLSKRVQKRQRL